MGPTGPTAMPNKRARANHAEMIKKKKKITLPKCTARDAATLCANPFLHPPDNLPLLGAARVSINAENGGDAGLVRSRPHAVGLAVLGRENWGDGSDGLLRGLVTVVVRLLLLLLLGDGLRVAVPRLLEGSGTDTRAVLGRDGGPEAGAVGGVDGRQARHVNLRVQRRLRGRQGDVAVKAQRRVVGRCVAGRKVGGGQQRWVVRHARLG